MIPIGSMVLVYMLTFGVYIYIYGQRPPLDPHLIIVVGRADQADFIY